MKCDLILTEASLSLVVFQASSARTWGSLLRKYLRHPDSVARTFRWTQVHGDTQGPAPISQPQAAHPTPAASPRLAFVCCDVFLPLPPHSPIDDGQDHPEQQPRPRAKTVHFVACFAFPIFSLSVCCAGSLPGDGWHGFGGKPEPCLLTPPASSRPRSNAPHCLNKTSGNSCAYLCLCLQTVACS